MDNMKLLENLSRLGFALMEVKEDVDVNKTLAEVVKRDDNRLMEGFPVLLVNVAQRYGFDYGQIMKHLVQKQDQSKFHELLLLSLALYRYFRLSFYWADQLKKNFSDKELATLEQFKTSLSKGEDVTIGNKRFHPGRLKTVFNNYFEKNVEKTTRLKEKYEELSLEYALSQLFPPKQKELFKKKLNGDLLTKTEREYYSRTVKKKVTALANPELHRLAQRLMEY